MQLISLTTGEIVSAGSVLHIVSGPNTGRAYRFERVYCHTDGTPRVHVTRTAPGRGCHFRAHFHLAPERFGCKLEEEITRGRHAFNTCRHVVGKVDDYLLAGLFAVIPLAVFENFHLADDITSVITLGMLGGGGH